MVSSIPTGLFPSGASKSFEETEMFRGTTMSTMDDPHQAGCPRHLGHTCYYLHICASVSEWEFLFYVLQLRQQLPLSFVIIFSLFIAPTAPPTHSPSSLASSCQCFPVFDASSHLVFLSVTVLCECQKLTPLTWKTCIMNGRPFLCVSLSHQSNWKTSPWLKGRSWLWFFRLSMIGNHKEWSCHVHTAGKISQSPNLFADICDLNLIF